MLAVGVANGLRGSVIGTSGLDARWEKIDDVDVVAPREDRSRRCGANAWRALFSRRSLPFWFRSACSRRRGRHRKVQRQEHRWMRKHSLGMAQSVDRRARGAKIVGLSTATMKRH